MKSSFFFLDLGPGDRFWNAKPQALAEREPEAGAGRTFATAWETLV
jgi:hypothetical protein